MGTRLESFPHQRLQGRPEFKLRVGDYRVLYEFESYPAIGALKVNSCKNLRSFSPSGIQAFPPVR
jgi:hypothetical protein